MKNNTLYEPQKDYQAPCLRLIEMNIEENLCDSSVPGGNEDIGYEDWQ